MVRKKSRKWSKPERHFVFWITYAVLLLGAIGFGGLAGLLFGYAIDLPRVEELQQIQPSVVSSVYDSNGEVIGQFAAEKRILVSYGQVPQRMRNAVIAAEDAGFFTHPGIDFRRLIATVINDVLHWELKGGSTLTMQISKMRFTSEEKTFERKIKDILYAINIEKTYSKEQIFTFYANQISMGHGRYGIAAAADFYFHKTLDELTLAECALLAGIIQAPGRHSPINRPERALARRIFVLGQMLDKSFITEVEYREALDEPLTVKGRDDEQSPAPYFVEEVRQFLSDEYQTDQIWQEGLMVHTTLDYDMQMAAQRALRKGLTEFDRTRRGWAGPIRNILDDGIKPDEFVGPDWGQLFYKDQLVTGLVLESDADSAQVKLGSYTATITPKEIAWTKRKKVNQVLKSGDVAWFRLENVNRSTRVIDAVLDQIPEVQGAVYILDNRTGAIRAMVGGFDFKYSKFNRAIQALRQPGSIFKPFTYVAAMEAGFAPHDQVLDKPVEFQDALGRPYAPTNWDDKFKGLITIRQALAESRNVPTVRLANALGPATIASVAGRFGFRQEFPPYLSIALGSVEVTLSEIVSAFSCFPNRGVRAEPYFVQRVEDHNGVILEEHRPSVHDAVVTPDVADKMLYLMREVVRSGSGSSLRDLGQPLGGKTGTTNEATDVWFVGFTTRITAGVWVGYDEKKSLGDRVFGSTLALPIWKDFMKEILADQPPEQFDILYEPQDDEEARIVDADGTTETESAEEEIDLPKIQNPFQVEDIAPPPSG